jgi:hypothetical protein
MEFINLDSVHLAQVLAEETALKNKKRRELARLL